LGGSRPTGIWSRPDIVTVEVRTFEYVPGKHLDVNTFEVKSWNAINVQAVYEALAHRRAATRSYVLFYIPPDKAGALKDQVEDVAAAARMHGIGVVTAGSSYDYETWEELGSCPSAGVNDDGRRFRTRPTKSVQEGLRPCHHEYPRQRRSVPRSTRCSAPAATWPRFWKTWPGWVRV
jgi:hypothetical protein